ncbi:protein Spindly isoform X2 [Brienomyrus brachyistius]|uniref:protein Spindly isoform X2 n=1 Tax=Brienomyrus brachyistius TaxID=42636 RepID=UPI0020B3B623|nr:protein Spindly isoform X2 [Brienomyrus brachyistius]
MSGDSEVQRLRCKLKEAEESLQKAAQYGLELLDGQLDLQNQLEEQRVEMTNTLEVLEQEKYSLQREVELKSRMMDSLRSEFEALRGQQRLMLEKQEAQLERGHSLELNELKSKVDRLKAELDEARLSEKQLRHKLDLQAEALANRTEELRALTERAHETMSSEVLELQVERAELEAAKVALERELQEGHYKEQQLELANNNLQHRLARLTEEKEEREKEAVSCFNALEKAREVNQDLQVQLDQLLQQAQDPNSKGNSLFSEVEDRRAEMERQLISMRVQHQSLLKQHAFSRQQLQRMKVQIATLMQLQGSRADPGQLERLQSMLSEKNNEIEALMVKVRRLEKVEMAVKAQPSGVTGDAESTDGTFYTDLLKMQLSNSQKDAEQLGDELSRQRMKAFSESQRVLELERKLFSTERALKLCQSTNIKLQVKLDELRLQYEPNELKKTQGQKRRHEKLPADAPEDPPALEKREAEAETRAERSPEEAVTAAAERALARPLLPARAAKPCRSARDTKCVRICEEATTIPDAPRSPSADCTVKTKAELVIDVGEENRKAERKRHHKSQGAIHVASEPTMEDQCVQQ